MAGSRPGGRIGCAMGSTLMFAGRFKPLSDAAISFVRDYDIKAMAAMLDEVSNCSFEEKMDTLSKNREQFKKPNAIEAFPNEFKSKDEEEEGEESDVEDGDYKEEEGDVEDEGEKSDVEDEDDKEEEGEESDAKDEDGEDEDEETLKLMVADNKPATDGQLQVPNEGEPEYKKPRFAQGSGCQAEAAV